MSAATYERGEVYENRKAEPNVTANSEAVDTEDTPFVKADYIEPSASVSTSKVKKNQRPAWFTTVSIGIGLASAVLLINVAILAWSYGQLTVDNGIAIAFTGSCSRTTVITTVAELAINVLSTLLLAASTSCGQLLVGPTRAEVDNAHAHQEWLHIGVSGFRNIKWIGRWRIALWTILALSSIPLHLLYNSVIFSSSYTSDYIASLVTQDFPEGQSWNHTVALEAFSADLNTSYAKTNPDFADVLQSLQNESRSLKTLDNTNCRAIFGSAALKKPYLNVLLVADFNQTDGFIDGSFHYAESGQNTAAWFNVTGNSTQGVPSACATPTATETYAVAGLSATETTMSIVSNQTFAWGSGNDWNISDCRCYENGDCSLFARAVVHCLAEIFEPQCTVNISTGLLIAVIVCNILKVSCLAITLLYARDFNPFATVGDAVASFLARPDEATANKGALSTADVYHGPVNQDDWRLHRKSRHELKLSKPKWRQAVNTGPSYLGLLCFSLLYIGLLSAMVFSFRAYARAQNPYEYYGFTTTPTNHTSAFSSLGSTWSHDKSTTGLTGHQAGTTLASNVLLVNLPQLAISFIYVFYNTMFTRMLTAHEYSKFATQRRGLRVSKPQGSQRSTYWLQVPYRYALPMMGAMTLLHWLVSRGIYLISVNIYDISRQNQLQRAFVVYGTSTLALLLAFLVGSIIILALFVFARRSLDPHMPVIGTCSMAISSACHPANGDEHPETKPLQFGVVVVDEADTTAGAEEEDCSSGRAHACFSSLEVEPWIDTSGRYMK